MATETVQSRIYPNSYRDSVELMRIAAEIEQLPGVVRAALLMASPANHFVLEEAGLLQKEAEEASPNDLVVAVAAENPEAASAAISRAAEMLAGQDAEAAGKEAERQAPQTIAEAVAELPSANLAIISTPGSYATAEALKALKRGLNVFLFSDNVPIADEVELKQLAISKGLLMMGADCGTAVLDGVPLGFANVLKRGKIGLIGASGTGLQQVSCLIDRLGEGISQVVGVGGHDLDERVGGTMMSSAFERLTADPETSVLVLISKPPSPSVARRVVEMAARSPKPVVVNFLGGDPEEIRHAGAEPAVTLEEAAVLAVALARGVDAKALTLGESEERLRELALAQVALLKPDQVAVRGLYSGGTLASEAVLILTKLLGAEAMAEQTVLDLGADEYTVGRPHPMIDFRLRNEKVAEAGADPSTAVILLDLVLGHGAHKDPAAAILPGIGQAHQAAEEQGRRVIVVASICGTEGDPQGLSGQEAELLAAGVLLTESNAEAARLAGMIVEMARARQAERREAA